MYHVLCVLNHIRKRQVFMIQCTYNLEWVFYKDVYKHTSPIKHHNILTAIWAKKDATSQITKLNIQPIFITFLLHHVSFLPDRFSSPFKKK